MRYVIVPSPVILVDRRGVPLPAPEVTLHSFIRDVVCSSPAIGNGGEGLRRVRKLDLLFATAHPGDMVVVEDADHDAAMNVINGAQWQSPLIASQQLPILEAFANACNDKPAETERPRTAPALVG